MRHSLCHIPALQVSLIIQNHLVFSEATIFFGDHAWQMPLSVPGISVYISCSVNLPLICHLYCSLSCESKVLGGAGSPSSVSPYHPWPSRCLHCKPHTSLEPGILCWLKGGTQDLCMLGGCVAHSVYRQNSFVEILLLSTLRQGNSKSGPYDNDQPFTFSPHLHTRHRHLLRSRRPDHCPASVLTASSTKEQCCPAAAPWCLQGL